MSVTARPPSTSARGRRRCGSGRAMPAKATDGDVRERRTATTSTSDRPSRRRPGDGRAGPARRARSGCATDRGVFSHGRSTPGTKLLLLDAPPPPPARRPARPRLRRGPIAVTMARRAPTATVWAVDVNERARALCAANAARQRVDQRPGGARPTTCPPTSASPRSGQPTDPHRQGRPCTSCCCAGSPGSTPTAAPTSSCTSTSAPTRCRVADRAGPPHRACRSGAGYRILRVT